MDFQNATYLGSVKDIPPNSFQLLFANGSYHVHVKYMVIVILQ